MKKRIISFFICVLFILNIISGQIYVSAATLENKSYFEIDFLDVGQGDAALVNCDGKYMLVDGGAPKSSSLIYTVLKNKKISYLDYIVATHPDADHIGGLSGALNYAKVGVAYSPVREHDTKTFGSFVKYLKKQGKSLTIPEAGDTFELGSAEITVWFAPLGPDAHFVHVLANGAL